MLIRLNVELLDGPLAQIVSQHFFIRFIMGDHYDARIAVINIFADERNSGFYLCSEHSHKCDEANVLKFKRALRLVYVSQVSQVELSVLVVLLYAAHDRKVDEVLRLNRYLVADLITKFIFLKRELVPCQRAVAFID